MTALRHAALLVIICLAPFFAATGPASAPASAQVCERPLCPSGWGYSRRGLDRDGRPYGSCEHCDGFPTFACSHTPTYCAADATLNMKTGMCELNVCTGGGCGAELPLCNADETYTHSGRDGAGLYGDCAHGPTGFGGYKSHQLKRCRTGWTLQPATGMCRKDCAVTPFPPGDRTAAPRPDLTFRRTWLESPKTVTVGSVRRNRAYYACYEVANIGLAPSGPFQVGAGGLGVPVAPVHSHPSLAPSTSLISCMFYPTTPPPGSYSLGLTADSRHLVTESREYNNDATLAVRVY